MNVYVIENIRRLMKRQAIEAVLIYGKKNKQYFGALTGSGVYLLVSQHKIWQIMDGRYTAQANSTTEDSEIIVCSKGIYIEKIKEILEAEKIFSLAIDNQDFTVSDFLQLQDSELQLTVWKDELIRVRQIKNSNELEKIKKVCALSDKVFEALVPKIKVGMKESEVSAWIHFLGLSFGAEKMAFEPIVVSGVRGAFAHGRPSNKVIVDGELLTVDFGLELEGYQSDCTRTFAMGEISQEQEKIYHTVLEAQLSSIEAVSLRRKARDIDKAARSIIQEAGYGNDFSHGLGHGIGMGGDYPILSPNSQDILENGMVMTCEPGIYIENFGGARIEDVVALYDDNVEILTKYTKELIKI